MVVSHNLLAMNANRQLSITTKSQSKSTEKLSSGYKINRAADDAAGLSISEKMRKQIRGLDRASQNAEDGISMVQIADGALEEVHAMLQRGNELCVQAANGTNSESDRQAIQDEIDQLNKEIDRISKTTKFNETEIFPTEKDGTANGVAAPMMTYSVVYNVAEGTFDITNDGKTAVYTDPSGTKTSTSILAERIANEFFPNAIKQILDAFPSLDDVVDSFEIKLNIGEIDGAGSGGSNTMAFASCSIGVKTVSGNSMAFASNFSFTVDSYDYSDADAEGTGAKAGSLESTIAHEMTHSLMYAAFPAEMGNVTAQTTKKPDGTTNAANDAAFPSWFIEGVAQLSGGGLSTDAGWNNAIVGAAASLTSATDTSKDADITTILKGNYTSDGAKEYGMGYLVSAYIGHKISNQASVSDTSIANGMDTLFDYIQKNDVSLDGALAHFLGAGTTAQTIFNSFANGDADKVSFVRELAYLSKGGNGSVITNGLNIGGTDLLGNMVKQADINYKTIGEYALGIAMTPNAHINLHVGADADMTNKIGVHLYGVDSGTIGTKGVKVTTENGATAAIETFGLAIQYVSTMRSYYGAIQNRLEHTVNNLDNVVENTTSAESRIRDTDMAEEMVEYSKNNILLQAGQSMLAQANQSTQGVMNLLQ